MTMVISGKGIRFLEEWEKKKNKIYPDSGGEPTIGIGHLLTLDERKSGKITIPGDNPYNPEIVKYKDGLSEEQMYALLNADLVKVESIVNISVKVPLTQDQYDALVAFTFNCGIRAFCNSTLLKVLNKAEYTGVPTQLARWVHDKGKVVQGLVNRRNDEIKLWNGVWEKREDNIPLKRENGAGKKK